MTLKEFMHTPNPTLDQIAIEAEVAREIAEDIAYDRRIEMKDKTLNQLLAEADKTNEVRDLINSREYDENKQNIIKENNNMNTTDKKELIIPSVLTAKFISMIANIGNDHNLHPVDCGFKTNNLNETEFKIYAKKVWKVKDQSKYEYPDKETHDKRYFHLMDVFKPLIKEAPAITVPEYQKPPISSWSKYSRQELIEMIIFGQRCVNTYLAAAPKLTISTTDIKLYNAKYTKTPGRLVPVTQIPLTVLCSYLDNLAEYNS